MPITKCASCDAMMPDDTSTCGRCGAALARQVGQLTPTAKSRCGSCGGALAHDAAVCAICGTLTGASGDVPSREERVPLPGTAGFCAGGAGEPTVAGRDLAGATRVYPDVARVPRGLAQSAAMTKPAVASNALSSPPAWAPGPMGAGVSDLPEAGLTPPPKRARRLGWLVGVLLVVCALSAATGAAAIGLRVSITSTRPIQPLLKSDNGAAVEAVAIAIVDELDDVTGGVQDRTEVLEATKAIISDGVRDGRWARSIEQGRQETLQVSRSGMGEAAMDVQWITSELKAQGTVDRLTPDILPVLVVSNEDASTLRATRIGIEITAIALPIVALISGALAFFLTRKDRLRSLRVFAPAAALTSVVLAALIATIPRSVVTARATTEAGRTLAGDVVTAIVAPTLVALGVVVILEIVLFVGAHLGVRRRMRQAKLDAAR